MASILLASTPTRHVAMDLAKVVIVQEAETNDSDAEVVGSGEPLPDQRQAAAAAASGASGARSRNATWPRRRTAAAATGEAARLRQQVARQCDDSGELEERLSHGLETALRFAQGLEGHLEFDVAAAHDGAATLLHGGRA